MNYIFMFVKLVNLKIHGGHIFENPKMVVLLQPVDSVVSLLYFQVFGANILNQRGEKSFIVHYNTMMYMTRCVHTRGLARVVVHIKLCTSLYRLMFYYMCESMLVQT